MEYKKNGLIDILEKVDQEVTLLLGEKQKRLSIVIVGGSALLLRDLTNRPVTHDIDVLTYDKALRNILANYKMINGAVAAYMDQIPYNFEDRLVPLGMETQAVEYFTPSLEDLVVMKLYGWRPNDREDLESPQLVYAINWSLLDKLVYDPDEAQASALSSRRYLEMVAIYERYAREHGHEPHA